MQNQLYFTVAIYNLLQFLDTISLIEEGYAFVGTKLFGAYYKTILSILI